VSLSPVIARLTRREFWAVMVATVTLASACQHESGTKGPDPLPGAASLIPAAPAPQPTPTPVPGTEPAEDPVPATPGGGGGSASCGEPIPPPLARLNVKLHLRQTDRVVLDSTAQVGPDAEYCRKIGYTDGRSFCPVRTETDPERAACEALRVGRAADTGRFGPTWTANGRPCEGRATGPSCLNHPDNQYLVFAYGAGTFRACAAGGVCGELTIQ
jgi:hypothetical protein